MSVAFNPHATRDYLVKHIVIGLLFCLSAVHCIAGQTPASAVVEFTEGKTAKFSSKGHVKSKGAVFTMQYPQSWSAQEGERPNIVQKFVSESGRGLEMALIITKTIPPDVPLTKESIKDTLSQGSLKNLVPEGSAFIRAVTTKIEGESAGLLEYSSRQQRVGVEIATRVLALIFFQGRTMVQVQFQVGGLSSNATEVSKRAALFRPLFQLMMNSIVFEDKWK